MSRPIQEGDAVMFLDVEGELVPKAGVWIAAEDEGVDSNGVARVLLQRINNKAEMRRERADWLWVTDTVEERLANQLMDP